MNINEVYDELLKINRDISTLMKKTEFDEYDDLGEIVRDKADPNENQLHYEARSIMQNLAQASWNINYLSKPIYKIGTIHLNEQGRYEWSDGYKEYTSGSGIEFLRHDDFYDIDIWQLSRVEYSDGYYIVGYNDLPMDNLTVRERK